MKSPFTDPFSGTQTQQQAVISMHYRSHDPWGADEEVRLVNDLIQQIRGHSFNIAVSAGEARESLTMIGDNARTIALAFRDVRKGRFHSAAQRFGIGKPPKGLFASKAFNAIQNNWMMYSYGWKPLIYEVHSAAEAVAKHFGGVTPHFSFRSKGKAFSKAGPYFGIVGTHVYPTWTVRKQIIARFATDKPLSNGAELGLTDPFSLAWELLPYSFVVDWFVPIGTFLENAAAIRSLNGGTFIMSRKDIHRLDVINGGWLSGPNYYEEVKFDRQILFSLPNPVPIPSVKELSSWTSLRHAVSGIALLGTLIR